MDEERTVGEKDDTVSLGKKFATLREKLGLTQSDIATRIHVRQTIIQDIENDKTINVPSVFLKGYIKSYAEVVGLPQEDYQPYLKMKVSQQSIGEMKNYSNKEQNKRKGKRLFFISLLIIIVIIGITLFFVWKDDKSNLVEVNHYISPPTSVSS